MAITRTPIINDDLSGKTGTIIDNAWKQELYNQIDGTLPQYGNWTPADASGAGLTLTQTSAAIYVKIGRWVWASFNLVYPTTADGTPTLLGGLPFVPTGSGAAGNGSGLAYTNFGAAVGFFVTSASTIQLYAVTGARVTNAQASGKGFSGNVSYLAVS